MAIEMNTTQILVNVYLGLLIPETSEIGMYYIWYDYIKSKYGKKSKLHYMDTDQCQKVRTRKSPGNENSMEKFLVLRLKSYGYLKYNGY